MGKYIVCNDELYHHGVKGMKWGVRRDRARRARVVAGIRKTNSDQLKKLEQMKLKRDKKPNTKKTQQNSMQKSKPLISL